MGRKGGLEGKEKQEEEEEKETGGENKRGAVTKQAQRLVRNVSNNSLLKVNTRSVKPTTSSDIRVLAFGGKYELGALCNILHNDTANV